MNIIEKYEHQRLNVTIQRLTWSNEEGTMKKYDNTK